MPLFLILLSILTAALHAGDSYFFKIDRSAPQQTIEDEKLVIRMPVKKLPTPKAESIVAFHQGLGGSRDYKIQIDLSAKLDDRGAPKLKLGDDTIVLGISVSHSDDPDFADTITLESGDKEQVLRWVKALQELLVLPDARVQMNLNPLEEKGGAE